MKKLLMGLSLSIVVATSALSGALGDKTYEELNEKREFMFKNHQGLLLPVFISVDNFIDYYAKKYLLNKYKNFEFYLAEKQDKNSDSTNYYPIPSEWLKKYEELKAKEGAEDESNN